MEFIIFLILTAALAPLIIHRHYFRNDSKISEDIRRFFRSDAEKRRDYYRNTYLKSEAWQRKRYVVLKRDGGCCVYCGAKATQVHHTRYAKRNIGREPIDWLVSICRPCHESIHGIRKTAEQPKSPEYRATKRF